MHSIAVDFALIAACSEVKEFEPEMPGTVSSPPAARALCLPETTGDKFLSEFQISSDRSMSDSLSETLAWPVLTP